MKSKKCKENKLYFSKKNKSFFVDKKMLQCNWNKENKGESANEKIFGRV